MSCDHRYLFLVAPLLYAFSFALGSRTRTYMAHGVALINYVVVYFGLPMIFGNETPAWIAVSFMLSIFLVPPMIVGSLVYSLILDRESKGDGETSPN